MGSKAPVGFTEFVLARGTALHRSAALLTRDDASAKDLVQAALAKAWRAWPCLPTEHDALVRRIMVTELSSGRRRPWSGEQPTDNLLAGLPPRQRAIVVLRFLDDCTEATAAEAMGASVRSVQSQTARALASLRVEPRVADRSREPVGRRRVREGTATTATLDDLRAALWRQADESTPPDPRELLAVVELRVAQRRRRGRILAAAALAVVAVGAGLAVSESSRRAPTPPPGPTPTDSARAIAEDPYFPHQESGASRLSIIEWRVSEQPIMLTWPQSQSRAFLRAYCTQTGDTVPQLRVTQGGRTAYLPCMGEDTPGRPPRLWLAAADGGRVLLEARGANAVGTARIALYEQPASVATTARKPPLSLDTDPTTSWSSVSEAGPTFGPPGPSSANQSLTITGRYEPDLLGSLIVRGPGALQATANGQPLGFSCHQDVDDLLGCPADGLLGRRVQSWGYGDPAHVYFGFENLAGVKPGSPVSITVQPSGFAGDDWRVTMLLHHGDGALPPTHAWSTP